MNDQSSRCSLAEDKDSHVLYPPNDTQLSALTQTEAACAGKIPQLSKKAFTHMQSALITPLHPQHYEMRELLVVSYTQKMMSLECKMTSLFDH